MLVVAGYSFARVAICCCSVASINLAVLSNRLADVISSCEPALTWSCGDQVYLGFCYRILGRFQALEAVALPLASFVALA